MAKIAFLLMVHKDPEQVIAKARALTAHGDTVAIHADQRMPAAQFSVIRKGLKDLPGVTFARRVRCGWGEWSLVAASLNMIRAARARFDGITHYYLISGDCYPTKSRGYIDRFLEGDRDHIEAHDFFETDWIKTGMKRDRLIFRHWFNERKQAWLFYTSLELQKRFKVARPLPKDLRIHIGSQWWVLRADTIEKMLDFMARRPAVSRFFKTTWIPDETFFQTLAAHLVLADEISGQPPTSLLFSDYGVPVVFYEDHHDFLHAQDRLFARKISANAHHLQARLLDDFKNRDGAEHEGGSGPGLYNYLAGRGRVGLRYRRRFWERAIAPRRTAEVLIVSAKLWHIGAEVERAAARVIDLPHLGYVFDEDKDVGLGLGNLECGLYKRNQHRHAFLNIVFDALEHDRLILAVDPARVDVIDDIAGLAGQVRILMVDRPLTEDHLRGHAERTGLISSNSGEFEQREAITSLKHEFTAAARDLRERYRGQIFTNDLDRTRDENIIDIGHFLQVTRPAAEAVAREAEKYRH